MFMRNKVSILNKKMLNNINHDHKTKLFRSEVLEFACAIDNIICLKYIENEIRNIENGRK